MNYGGRALARFASSPVGHLVPVRGTDGRSGKLYDHVGFVSDPLGDEPTLSGTTWRAVSAAGYALGRLNQAAQQVPSPTLLRRPTLRREAQSTSALEGTFAPLNEVLAADVLADTSWSAQLREVLNYVAVAEAAFGWLAEGRRLTVGMLCELQRLLVETTPVKTDQSGQVRPIQVVIGSGGGSITEARFVPQPPGLDLEAGLQDLLTWINESVSERRDPVVATALAHYQFETLHPFHDGNGRIAGSGSSPPGCRLPPRTRSSASMPSLTCNSAISPWCERQVPPAWSGTSPSPSSLTPTSRSALSRARRQELSVGQHRRPQAGRTGHPD